MSSRPDRRPAATEYEAYYSSYIDRTPDGPLVETMTAQIAEVDRTFRGLSPERAGYRYAPGKWTIREVLGHLIDTERVFGYRAVSFSRADPAPLPSFDQALWNPAGRYDERPIGGLVDEWIATRRATIAFAAALPDEAWNRTGIASDFPFTVRAALWILPGHVRYHLAHLADRYR